MKKIIINQFKYVVLPGVVYALCYVILAYHLELSTDFYMVGLALTAGIPLSMIYFKESGWEGVFVICIASLLAYLAAPLATAKGDSVNTQYTGQVLKK